MLKKLLFITILSLFVASCDNGGGQGHGMMGGGGMMGGKTLTETFVQQPEAEYIPGYLQAKTTCSQCHNMPLPKRHTRAEWPGVIARMEGHIETYRKKMPSSQGLRNLVAYYVGNSK